MTKIKLTNSAKRVFTNVFSPKVEGEDALIPENIKKDISIFGVKGTYEGGDTPAPTELTPFQAGQLVNGIVVDTNGMSTSDLINTLSNIPSDGYVLELARDIGIAVNSGILGVIGDDSKDSIGAVFNPNLSDPWNTIVIGSSEPEFTPFTGRITIELFDTITVTNEMIKEGFSELNGVVFGAAIASPTPTGLTPFSNQNLPYNIGGIKVDTGALTNAQMNTFLAKFDMSQPIVFVGKSDGEPYVVIDPDIQGLMIVPARPDTYVAIVYTENGVPEMSIPAGWVGVTANNEYVSISGQVDLVFSDIVGYVDENAWSDFQDINGIAVGTLSAQPSEDLTPFELHQSVSGIIVDPTATPEGYASMAEYMNALPTPGEGTEHEGSESIMGIGNNGEVVVSYVDRITTGAPSWGVNALMIYGGEDFVVYYAPQEIIVEDGGEVVATIPAGWSQMNMSTGEMESFTTQTTFSFTTNTVEDISSKFAPLNGTVVGSVIAS